MTCRVRICSLDNSESPSRATPQALPGAPPRAALRRAGRVRRQHSGRRDDARDSLRRRPRVWSRRPPVFLASSFVATTARSVHRLLCRYVRRISRCARRPDRRIIFLLVLPRRQNKNNKTVARGRSPRKQLTAELLVTTLSDEPSSASQPSPPSSPSGERTAGDYSRAAAAPAPLPPPPPPAAAAAAASPAPPSAARTWANAAAGGAGDAACTEDAMISVALRATLRVAENVALLREVGSRDDVSHNDRNNSTTQSNRTSRCSARGGI
jgi:hypothetical protein